MNIDMKKFEKKIPNIITTIFVFFLFFNLPMIIASKVKKLGFSFDYNSAVIYSLLVSILTSIFLIMIYWKDLKKEFKTYFKNLSVNFDCGVRYWFIGLVIMCVSNLILSYVFKTGGAENEQGVQQMIDTLPFATLIYAGVVAPINEELVFRKSLKEVFSNKWVFAIMSFLLFGYAHVSGTKNMVQLLYIIPYGALGGAFALAYDETDTVFTSMFMHMIHNIVLTLISILFIF